MIVHDTTLTRTTDVEEVFPERAPWNVGDFTLAEIKQLDAGSWFAPKSPVSGCRPWSSGQGGGPPRRHAARAEVELYPGIEQDLDKELRSLPDFNRALRTGKVAVQSFNHEWLKVYADLAPDVPVGLLYGDKPTDAAIEDAATWADQVNPALGIIDESTVQKIHAEGLETHVWTVNAGQDIRPRHQLGRRRHHHQLPAGPPRHPAPPLSEIVRHEKHPVDVRARAFRGGLSVGVRRGAWGRRGRRRGS